MSCLKAAATSRLGRGLRGQRFVGSGLAMGEGFFYQAEDGAPVFSDGFDPSEATHLREVDTAETEAGDKDIDAVAEGLVRDGGYGVGDCFRTVRFGPAALHLGMGFVDGHFQGRVGHRERYELLPVF